MLSAVFSRVGMTMLFGDFVSQRSCRNLVHRRHCLRQVFPQVFHIFQSDIQPHDSVAVVWAVLVPLKIVCYRQACHAGPAVSDLEEFQCVDKSLHFLFRELAAEDYGEDSRGP